MIDVYSLIILISYTIIPLIEINSTKQEHSNELWLVMTKIGLWWCLILIQNSEELELTLIAQPQIIGNAYNFNNLQLVRNQQSYDSISYSRSSNPTMNDLQNSVNQLNIIDKWPLFCDFNAFGPRRFSYAYLWAKRVIIIPTGYFRRAWCLFEFTEIQQLKNEGTNIYIWIFYIFTRPWLMRILIQVLIILDCGLLGWTQGHVIENKKQMLRILNTNIMMFCIIFGTIISGFTNFDIWDNYSKEIIGLVLLSVSLIPTMFFGRIVNKKIFWYWMYWIIIKITVHIKLGFEPDWSLALQMIGFISSLLVLI